MIRKGLYILLAVVAAMVVGGCTTDLPDEGGGTGNARFTISVVQNNSAATRADNGKPEDPESDKERINDWWMVFVQANGTVRKILERKDANPGVGSYTGEALPVVDEEYFECDLPRGNYIVYAFANITQTELKEATGITFKEGEKPNGVGQDAAVSTAEWKTELNFWDKSKKVPMTGIKSITVKNTVEETFSIEVVRMVAKIDFSFTNETASEISVKSVSIRPITISGRPVSLMPNYDCLGKCAFSDKPLGDDDYEKLTYAPSAPLSLLAMKSENTEETLAATDGDNRLWFYCKESLSNLPTKLFTVGVKISRTKDGVEYDDEELLYSPTYKVSDYINRNDWIKIPITFTDWIVDFDVMFYPPIGGYPAVKEEESSDGESHYFTFSSQGKFVITPKIRKAAKGSPWLQPAEGTTKVSNLENMDGVAIFSKAPAVDPNTGEIIGELADETGSGIAPSGMAMVTVEFTPPTENGMAAQTVTRRIYIIRK